MVGYGNSNVPAQYPALSSIQPDLDPIKVHYKYSRMFVDREGIHNRTGIPTIDNFKPRASPRPLMFQLVMPAKKETKA